MIRVKGLNTKINKKIKSILPRWNSITGMAIICSLCTAIYWLAIASDLYVSEAHIVIQRTDLAGGPTMDFASLLGGGGGDNQMDQLLLRDHLMSIDMLKKLDNKLNLREHYSDSGNDVLSRLWFKDTEIERFHAYYLTRISVEYDEYAGVLVIKSQGYDAKTAYAITKNLVQEGEDFMNELAHSLAKNQVLFMEKQVVEINRRVIETAQAVLKYQDIKGLVSPRDTATTIAGIIANLEIHQTELEIQRSAGQAYLVPGHSKIVQINQEIKAVQKQINQEKSKLVSTKGKTLNKEVLEFQRLEMEAGFAQDIYKTALIALETGRIEATRTIKKVAVLQTPTYPEYPLEPRRLYNAFVFFLLVMLLAGIVYLLIAIIRDHKD